MQHEQTPLLVDEPIFSSEIQKWILGGFVGIGIVMGGWFLWTAQVSGREDEAHAAIVAAKSPEEKRQVADRYSGTKQAALVYLSLANDKLDTKPQEALELYDLFLSQNENHILANAARLGKGRALEALQKVPEAIGVYQSMTQTKSGDAYEPIALLNLSRLQLAQGQTAPARQSLQDLMIRHPDYASEAKERLKLIPESKS